jgi:hypothetical protein
VGPVSESFGHFKYYVSFIDDYSKFTWIYLLKKKSDVFQKFCDFQQHVERLFDKKMLDMQTDWGGEYQKLNSFFQRVLAFDGARKEAADAKLTCSRQSLCVVNDQPVGNPKRKV